MASIAVRTYLTPEGYLAFERKATTKHEYLAGESVAMSGASFDGNFITGVFSVFRELEDVMLFPSIECELCLRDIYNSVDLGH